MNDVDGAGLQGLTSLTVAGGGGGRVTSKANGAASWRYRERKRGRSFVCPSVFLGNEGRFRG